MRYADVLQKNFNHTNFGGLTFGQVNSKMAFKTINRNVLNVAAIFLMKNLRGFLIFLSDQEAER